MKKQHQNNQQDRLKDLLNEQLMLLSNEAVRTNGKVDDQRYEELQRLARLIELQKPKSNPAPSFRWPVLGLLALTLLVVSILFFARVGSTEIELDLSMTEFEFRSVTSQVLTRETSVASLGISGAKEIHIPSSGSADSTVKENPTSLRLLPVAAEKDKSGGTVTLPHLLIPSGTEITIKSTGNPDQLRILLVSQELELNTSIYGNIQLAQPGIGIKSVNYPFPKSVDIFTDSGDLSLDIKLLNDSRDIFSDQIPADSLSFFTVDQYMGSTETVIRKVSTIETGAVYLESLGGKKIQLRSGQQLKFSSSPGSIRSLQYKDGLIVLSFQGRVKGMTTGTEENPQNIMPTYLEWLKARHGLSLLWGTTIYFFGLVLGILKWWRNST